MSDKAGFRTIDLFADLSEDALAAAVDGLEAVHLDAGDEFDVGASRAVCCVVGVGRLALAVVAPEERERTIGLLEQGDLLVRPIDPWAASGPQVRCFAIEESFVHLVDRPGWSSGCATPRWRRTWCGC